MMKIGSMNSANEALQVTAESAYVRAATKQRRTRQ